MSARVCLVTGGTSGVGKSIARGLARSGATVILVSRDAERGAAAAEELRADAGHDRVEAMTADLSSMDSVRALADSVRRRHDALNVLSNNAALLVMTRRVTPDGVEAIFATNYLGHFLLTNLLIDMLKASAPARVLTSPLTRARQTAAILAERAGWPKAVDCAELAPGVSPEALFAVLRRLPEERIAVVGHEPGLGRLVAAALPGAPAAQAFRFKKMGAALLVFQGAARVRGAQLTWLLPARVLRAAR